VPALHVLAVSANAGVVIQEEHPIDWYDCSGRPTGTTFIHKLPRDSSVCSGGMQSKGLCNCGFDPVRCPDGRLLYIHP
ncbi:hypothetical protein Ocin01_18507, partial [Orchesella cincta]